MPQSSELADYIKEKRGGGLSDEAIRTILTGAGWDKKAIEAFTALNSTGGISATPSTTPPAQTEPYAPAEPPKSRRLIKMLAIFITIVAISVGAFIFTRIYFGDPLAATQNSFVRFAGSTSWIANISFPPNSFSSNVSATINFHKDTSQFSQAKITAANINGSPDKSGSLTANYNNKDLYLNFYYSKMDDVLNQFATKYPPFLNLRTFILLQPFLLNQGWLHLVVPTSTVNQATSTVIDATRSQLAANFSKTFIIKSYNQNFSQNGGTYRQVIVAIDKTGLINFLQGLKNYDLNISIAQLNSFIGTVNSMSGWDGNIFEILIDKNTGDLSEIKVSLPKLPPSVLQQVIPSSIPTSTENPFAQFLSSPMQSISSFFNQDSASGSLLYVGRIDFSGYNQASPVNAPTQFGEFSDVQTAVAGELPFIISILNTPAGSSTTSTVFTRDLQQASFLFTTGKYDDLLKRSQALLKEATTDKEKSIAHYWIGLAYASLNIDDQDKSKSEELLAIKLNPKFSDPYVVLSALSLSRGIDCPKALGYAQTAVDLNGLNADAHNYAGLAYSCLGNKQKALAEVKRAVQLAPNNYSFQYNLKVMQDAIGGK